MKQIKPAWNMTLDIKWNATMDGTVICQAFEASGEQAQFICTPWHLREAFTDLCKLMKENPSVPEDQKAFYRALIPLLVALQKAEE